MKSSIIVSIIILSCLISCSNDDRIKNYSSSSICVKSFTIGDCINEHKRDVYSTIKNGKGILSIKNGNRLIQSGNDKYWICNKISEPDTFALVLFDAEVLEVFPWEKIIATPINLKSMCEIK